MKNIFYVVILFVIALGCKQETIVTGPSSTNQLTGFVQLSDAQGRIQNDASGVIIRAVGTNYSAVTNDSGIWRMNGLLFGTYSLQLSRSGYESWTTLPFRYTSGMKFYNQGSPVVLGMPPVFTLTLDAIVLPQLVRDSTGSFYAPGQIFCHTSANAPDSTSVGACIVAAKHSNISLSDSLTNRLLFDAENNVGDSTFSLSLDLSNNSSLLAGFLKGDTIYVRAFPYLRAASYLDRAADEVFLTCIGTTGSNVLSVIVQ